MSFLRNLGHQAGSLVSGAVETAKKRQSAARHRSPSVSVEIDALELELICGNGLIAADKNGKSDPYVKIYAANAKLESKVKPKTLDPKWNQTFYLEETEESIRFDVYDKDRLDKDDFLGWAEVDASEVAGDAYDEPREFKLDVYTKKGSTDKTHGTITITLTRTKIPASKLSYKGARRKYAKIVGTQRLMVDVIEARKLLVADSDGFSDPYVRLKVGKKKYKKTTVVYSNLNPVWNERFQLDVPEGTEDLLQIQVYDRDVGIGNDDLIGQCEVKFHQNETNVRVEDYYRLHLDTKEGRIDAGWIKLGTTLMEQGKAIVINNANKVSVEIVKAVQLKSTPKAFVEVELGHSMMYTEIVSAKESPKWESVFQLPITDVYQDVILSVYSGDYDDKKFLGRVMMPILDIKNKQQEYFVLKDEECLHPVGGEIQLAFEASYSSMKPYLNLIKRHDKVDYSAKAAEQRGGLLTGTRMLSKKVRRIRGHTKRINQLIKDIKSLIAPIQYILNWKNEAWTVMWMILWVPICLLFRAWMVPAALSIYYTYNFYFNNVSKRFDVNEDGFYVAEFVKDKKSAEEEAEEEEEMEMEEKEEEVKEDPKKQPTMKKSTIKSALRFANIADTNLDFVASIGERFENLANWSSPQITRVVVLGMSFLTIVLFLLPFNIFVMVGGLGFCTFKFYKTHIKPPKTEKQKLRKPSNELVNMILRLPTHQLKLQRARLQPSHTKIKKSRMKQKLDRADSKGKV